MLMRSNQPARPKERIRAAGLRHFAADEGTEQCIKFEDGSKRPETPPKQSLYRTVKEPGARVLPHGPLRSEHVDSSKVFGKVDKESGAHVGDTIKREVKPLDAYMESRGEKIYRSTQREALGRGYSASEVPQSVKDRLEKTNFRFGQPTKHSNGTAKESIFPNNADLADQEAKAASLYSKSHRSFPVGVRNTNNMNWETVRVDPNLHRFGKKAGKPEQNGVGACLRDEPDTPTTAAQKSRVVPAAVEDFRQVSHASLGHSKYHGSANPSQYPEAFGRPGAKQDEWGAADCLRGDYTADQQLPDRDLGRSLRPGYRNEVKDLDRRFGIPSVRYDLPQNKSKKNNDLSSYDLIAPSAYADRNIGHEDFLKDRNADELRSIFSSIGYDFTEDEFHRLWYHASHDIRFTADGVVSVEEFRTVVNEYMDALEDNKLPFWWEESETSN